MQIKSYSLENFVQISSNPVVAKLSEVLGRKWIHSMESRLKMLISANSSRKTKRWKISSA